MRLPSSGIPAGPLIQIRARISAVTGRDVSQADVKARSEGPSKAAANKQLCRTVAGVGKWCALQGSNLRPHPCEGCALPLS